VWGIRIAAIIAGMTVTLLLEYWLGARWYISLPSGAFAYLIARYIGWAVAERRRFKLEMDQVAQNARRGDTRQNSN
jgi:4-amino-4-deoxy-L-arabinose transferase-like glycosyltransferase